MPPRKRISLPKKSTTYSSPSIKPPFRKTKKVAIESSPPADTELDYTVGDEDEESYIDPNDIAINNDGLPELMAIDPAHNLKERYEYIPQVRREIIILAPENRRTSEFMTKFECCNLISLRAKQIEDGGPIFVDEGELTDPREIAKLEIQQRKCPLSIIRYITDTIVEEWDANEMGVNWE